MILGLSGADDGMTVGLSSLDGRRPPGIWQVAAGVPVLSHWCG